ncbi:MAG: bifunctional metallophosphatase/5'-nucleotidase, partial [Polaromonas sp.]|nr:bifunctional metallophosphatase/5'-nucleotidase [Polaromonas sp.]
AVDTLVNTAGVVQNPGKSYRVTVNNFIADGGDGFSTLLKGTNRIGGAQDIDALTGFLANFKTPKTAYALGANAVDAGSPRINRVGSVGTGATCPSGANVNL